MPGSSDRRSLLFDSITRGDARAVDSLIVEYLPQLRAFLRARMDAELRRRESCSDLAQSVCRELLAREDGFDYRGEAEFRGWLFTAALNRIRQKHRFYRAARRDAAREAEAISQVAAGYATIGSPSAAAAGHEEIERLEAALDSLSDEHREVIALVRIADLPYEEVGARMGRTPEAVRKLLGRALLKLGAALEGSGGR